MAGKRRISDFFFFSFKGVAGWTGFALLALALAGPPAAVAQVSISDAPPRPHGLPAGFKPPPPSQPTDPKTFPRTPDGKPDFTGIWNAGFGALMGDAGEPLTPAYSAKREEWNRSTKAGRPYADSVSRCEAFGMPRMMNMLGLEFLMTPGKQVTIIEETLHEVRRIYLDGRSRPRDFDAAYDGYSVGHWEGDVLVVETTGLREGDGGSGWLSPNAHIVERISMINPDALKNDITITDQRLTGPWKYARDYTRAPKGTQIEEYICTENNRNLPDEKGFQTVK